MCCAAGSSSASLRAEPRLRRFFGVFGLVVAEGIGIHAGQPAQSGLVPSLALHGLLPSPGPLGIQPVDVEIAVEMVVLVLQDAGEPARGLEGEHLALQVQPGDLHVLAALERIAVARR